MVWLSFFIKLHFVRREGKSPFKLTFLKKWIERMEERIMGVEEILKIASDSSFAIWFLIGAALVFFMQAGFAMVETGFTRAKSAGNIIMKNLMDFCIGTVKDGLPIYSLWILQARRLSIQ